MDSGSCESRSRAQTLPKAARVRKRYVFLAMQRAGRRLATRHFLLVHELEGEGPAQLGITVTRKIGPAVVRNRIKRAVRELFRLRRAWLQDGLRVVVIARQGAGNLEGRAVTRELAPAFAQLEGTPQELR